MKLSDRVAANTLAFVLAGGAGRRLDPLTRYRPKPLVPFGGYFRILDFALSNCLNSELDRVYVLTQHEREAMAAYLRKGWSRVGGFDEFAVASPALNGKRYAGTADALLQNIAHLQKHRRLFALVISADHVYKMDYRTLLNFHASSAADVTIATVDQPGANGVRTVPVNMGVYVFNYETLLGMLPSDGAQCIDIDIDLIPRLLRSHRVNTYRHADRTTGKTLYWRDVDTLEAYYAACMDLLEADLKMDPYGDIWPIRSCSGARFGRSFLLEAGAESDVNSLIPQAVNISGASVYRSVLSPGVVLESGADVRHSVLLPGAVIRRGAVVRNAIIDAHVIIEAWDNVGYSRGADQTRFRVLPNGVAIVSPDHISPFIKVNAPGTVVELNR